MPCGMIFKWNDFPVTVFDGIFFGGMICPASGSNKRWGVWGGQVTGGPDSGEKVGVDTTVPPT